MLLQAQLPGNFGGMHLTSPLVKLQVAHLASIAASWKPTFDWLKALGYSETSAFAAIDTDNPRTTLRMLAGKGIFITTV